MKGRFSALLTVVALMFAATGWAQSDVGDISGRVMDNSGAVLPGVTVTATSPVLINPLTAISSETGTYQFPRVPIGTYTVKFELPGFKTLVREDVRVTVGFNAQVNAQLAITEVQETITVTGESPVVDIKNTSNKSTFDLETLQNIPSARDPWVMLERTPAITMDRVNVGGNQSGQQSGYVSRGTTTGNNKWYIDGVDITDMSATGASPIYYDFDMLQEMQVTTGGPDASQQTGGVGINLVTRSGTNMFKGSGRLYNTNDKFEADNVTQEIKDQGAGSGNPIQNINDFGIEAGGPILKDRLWAWGSYGRQDIKVGVVNFYENTPTCRPPGVPVGDIAKILDTDTLRDCLATDQTILNNYNWKLTYAPITNNKFNFQNTWAEKVRNARDASDTRPLETAYRQKAVDSSFGTFGWDTGPSPFWKAGDQHIFTDRLLLDVTWAHLGNNFTLTFQDPSQRDVQRIFDTTSGKFARSYDESIFLRPTNSVDITTSYFLPGALGGDHSFKVGYRYRTAFGQTIAHTGGNAEARYQNGLPSEGGTAFRTRLYRDGNTQYDLLTHGFYAQDNFTVKRLTLNLGVRFDSQHDEARASSVPAHPFSPLLPALEFPGIDPGITWNDWSPRLGMTYDLSGDGRTVARASYAIYYGQMGPGQIASNLLSVGQVFVEHPWNDLNRDTVVQANEVNFAVISNRSATYDLNNPTNFRGPGAVDPNVKNDRTREFIVGFDREIMNNMAVGASYIWRKYDQFLWQDRNNWTSDANWVQASFTPTTCPNAANGARCETVTYFRPTSQIPGPFTYTNIPDRHRDYNGFELTLTKRYSNRWQASGSFAYNDAVNYWDSSAAYEDASCALPNLPDERGCPPSAKFAPQSAGSGIDNIYTNAKWLFKTNAMYSLPWGGVNAAGNFLLRQGYPFPQGVLTPDRGNGGGQVTIMLDPLGDVRLPNTYTLDLRADRPFEFGKIRLIPSVDVFNVTNANTIQSRRVNQIATNANNISSIIPPRVIRFGLRVNW